MNQHVIEINENNFEQEVLKSNQPVLVDFWAPWCAPCRVLAPTIDSVAEEFNGSARVAKVNVDDNPQVSQHYGIKGIPTLILFKDGKEEERIVGSTSKEAIARIIDRHLTAVNA